ncbi:MAG: hypothetical protein GC129_00155 [Proteobacteria bacterium]|nr:hypothetical protein [Pseudomonadota bacterium]
MAKMCLPLLMLLLAAPAWADELFDAQAQAARYSLDFAAIEPAAGEEAPAGAGHTPAATEEEPAVVVDGVDEAAPSASEAHDDAAANEGEHAAGEGEGHAPKKKSPVKPLPPELPKVTIGGVPVITHEMQIAEAVSESTPQAFKQRGMDEFLAHRANIIPYAHDPSRGELDAPVQVVLFEDLSCGQCLPQMAAIDAKLADYTSQTHVVQVLAASARYQDTNLTAFYGKVAQRVGKFWDYRAKVIAGNLTDPDALFDLLVDTGVPARTVRSMMQSEARRFYRELDADSLLARTFAVGKPPVVYVNGIRVGEGGLPLDKLSDVLSYVTGRIAHGLPEPPL